MNFSPGEALQKAQANLTTQEVVTVIGNEIQSYLKILSWFDMIVGTGITSQETGLFNNSSSRGSLGNIEALKHVKMDCAFILFWFR